MKKRIIITLFAVFACLGFTIKSNLQTTTAQIEKEIPDVIVLAQSSKLGKVTFNHGDHATKNFNLDGTAPIKCIECHHVEQPVSEVEKNPPLKTAYPADRTVSLTAESFKDAATPAVTACSVCHIAKGAEPTLLTEIPQITREGKEPLVLTNQIAFHNNCTSCHNEVVKARPTVKAPTTMKCIACHKKG